MYIFENSNAYLRQNSREGNPGKESPALLWIQMWLNREDVQEDGKQIIHLLKVIDIKQTNIEQKVP